jgi:hypothetical protein
LQQHAHVEWFSRWLLQGLGAPEGVYVPGVDVVNRCAKAWHYRAHCRAAGLDGQIYVKWFRDRSIPDLRWLRWLYGAPSPVGVFVVDHRWQRLRVEMTKKAARLAAKICTRTLWLWEGDESIKHALARALEVASTTGRRASLTGCEPWEQLSEYVKNQMWTYARASAPAACRERAGVANQYDILLRNAETIGAKEELLRWLKGEDRPKGGPLHYGMSAGKLFVPTPGMLAFREVAGRETAAQKVSKLKDVPGLEEWFVDWTNPNPGSERYALPAGAKSEVNDRAQSKETEVTRETPKPPPPPPPFVPLPFQRRILNELKYKSLTADRLQEHLACDRKSLYVRGLRELTRHGLVVPSRRIGYYRPDFPPPEFAEFLGKNPDPETEQPTEETE